MRKLQRESTCFILGCVWLGVLGIGGCGVDRNPSLLVSLSGKLISSQSIPVPSSVSGASAALFFKYDMAGVGGKLVQAQSLLFLPQGQAPVGGWPVVAWGHGTDGGISNACATSLDPQLGGYGSTIISRLLNEGYAIVAPDYEGFGSAAVHPFLHLRSEGASLIYAVRAAKSIAPSLSSNWAAVGHSQGGHAVLGAAQYADSLVPDLHYRGTVAMAPFSNISQTLGDEFALVDQYTTQGDIPDAADRLAFIESAAAFVGAAVGAYTPGANPSAVAGSGLVPLVAQATDDTPCGQGVFTQGLSAHISTYLNQGGDPRSYPGLRRDWLTIKDPDASPYQEWVTTLSEPGTVHLSEPVMIVQGQLDTNNSVAAADLLVGRLDANRDKVTYKLYSGTGHDDLPVASAEDTVAYLKTIFSQP